MLDDMFPLLTIVYHVDFIGNIYPAQLNKHLNSNVNFDRRLPVKSINNPDNMNQAI